MSESRQELFFYGAEDEMLTGDSDTSKLNFFTPGDSALIKADKFVMETIGNKPIKRVVENAKSFHNDIIEYYGKDECVFGKTYISRVKRQGDLAKNFALQFFLPVLPEGQSYCNYLGYKIIENIKLDVGGSQFDNQYSNTLYNYDYMNNLVPSESSMLFISQSKEQLKTWSQHGNCYKDGKPCINLIVPITMWFKYFALPLISLQWHSCKVYYKITQISELVNIDVGTSSILNETIYELELLCDYIYIESKQKEQLINHPQNALIDQTQFTGNEIKNKGQEQIKFKLCFNHPMKYLLVTFCEVNDNETLGYLHTPQNMTGSEYGYGIKNGGECFETMTLFHNGKKRCNITNPLYYREYQGMKYLGKPLPKGMYLFSFALTPFTYQTSGTCNYSRIDNCTLIIQFPPELKDKKLCISVTGQSVQLMHISQGMAGLKYSK